MIEEVGHWFGEITPGGVASWGTWFTLLAIFWKGLPAIIDAVANRQSKIEERMGKLLDDATARFTREIEAADKRHDDCVAGQEKLAKRVTELEECIAQQQRTIEGLRRQELQRQASTLREGGELPPAINAMIGALNKLPGVGE